MSVMCGWCRGSVLLLVPKNTAFDWSDSATLAKLLEVYLIDPAVRNATISKARVETFRGPAEHIKCPRHGSVAGQDGAEPMVNLPSVPWPMETQTLLQVLADRYASDAKFKAEVDTRP